MIERWELIQAQSLSEKHRHQQDLQQWQQLLSDLQNMRAWLGRAEAELARLRELVHSTEIDTIQQRIRKLKVCLLLVFFASRRPRTRCIFFVASFKQLLHLFFLYDAHVLSVTLCTAVFTCFPSLTDQ